MQINKFIAKILTTLGLLALFATPALAVTPTVSITQLPGYINYTDFKLSYSAINNDPASITAQFYSWKDGLSPMAFGPVLTGASGQVQVSGSQFGSEGLFHFKVVINSGEAESETSTTLDTTAPGNVFDFGKDRTNGNTTYKLHFRNPLDSDYKRVFIYRGTAAGFSADNDHKVAELGGNPGDVMTWEDNGLDPTKEYFYAVRALDRADNSSGLVGDAGATTTATSGANGQVLGASTSTKVTKLPKEGGVLGGGTTEPSPTAASTANEEAQGAAGAGGLLGSTRNKFIAGAALLVVAYLAYGFFKKKE